MITQNFIQHPLTRPALRPEGHKYRIQQVKAVAIHWTANTKPGADAMAHRAYFNNGAPGIGGTFRAASAHYCVDGGERNPVVQLMPTTEVAFHCGDKPLGKYKTAGKNMIAGTSGLTPNYFTIGIELCVNPEGDWNKTFQRGAMLAARELERYGLTITDGLLRHWDITGKKCPQMFLKIEEWNKFRAAVSEELDKLRKEVLFKAVCTTPKTNIRPQPGMGNVTIGTLDKWEPVLVTATHGDWYEVWPGGWAHKGLFTR